MAAPLPAPSPVRVEDAVPADWPRIAGLTVGVYRDERLGFTRLPERDWHPVPGVELLVYALDL